MGSRLADEPADLALLWKGARVASPEVVAASRRGAACTTREHIAAPMRASARAPEALAPEMRRLFEIAGAAGIRRP